MNVTISWSPWYSFGIDGDVQPIPSQAGLYQIRRRGRSHSDYIGQTGRGQAHLRSRLAQLRRGTFAERMPFRDPHTAAPALWAIRDATGEEFEVSVFATNVAQQMRLGIEAWAIAQHRLQHGFSPTASFGRMITGYRISSYLKGGYRGGRCTAADQNNLPGIPPKAAWSGLPTELSWCGHIWSPWVPFQAGLNTSGIGLYRIRVQHEEDLLYIGQGRIANRLEAHRQKPNIPGHRQGELFGTSKTLECSWVQCQGLAAHQLLEWETDLIGAHLEQTGKVPAAQFLG